MMYTSERQIKRAIENGDIATGMEYTKTSGVFRILGLDGNGDIIGHTAEMIFDDDGNGEPADEYNAITAADLINAEF